MKYKPTRYKYNNFKKMILTHPNALQEYTNLNDEFTLIKELILARMKANKTQKDLAKKMHTSSSAISRLESFIGNGKHSPTIETLKKYADAVGCKLSIKLIPLVMK